MTIRTEGTQPRLWTDILTFLGMSHDELAGALGLSGPYSRALRAGHRRIPAEVKLKLISLMQDRLATYSPHDEYLRLRDELIKEKPGK